MAAPVGSLIVRVGSDIRGLVTGLGKSGDLVKRFGSEASKAAKRIALISTAAAAAGAAIAIKLTRDGLRSVDAMVKLGRTIGATQAEMVALNQAANDVGIAQEKMQKNVQAFTKRLGEAMEGTGEAGAALEKLGLTAQQLASMPLPAALALVAERVQGLGTAAERAAAESDLFSRAGIGMLTTTGDLAGAIRLAEKNTRDFGIAVTQIEAAQIEAANDAMGRLGLAFQGIGTQLAVKLAPVLQEVADRITEASREGRGFGDAIEIGVSRSVRFVGALINGFREFQKQLLTIDATAADLERKRLILFGTPEELSAATRAFEDAAQRLGEFQNLPPFDVDEFLRNVREKAEAAAVAAGAVTSGMDVGDPLGRLEGGGEEDPELAALREKAAARLEIIRQGLMSERELEQVAFEEKMAHLREGKDLELLGEEEFKAQKEALEQQHQDRMTEIMEDAADAQKRIEEEKKRAQIATAFGAAQALASIVENAAQENFALQKAAAIAGTIINAIESAANAYTFGSQFGPGVAAAMAAVAFAAQSARLAAIRSSDFKSGGGGAAAGAGSGSAPTAALPAPGGGGATGGGASAQSVNISLVGERFGRSQVRDLIGQINDAVADGARLRIV